MTAVCSSPFALRSEVSAIGVYPWKSVVNFCVSLTTDN